MTEAVVVSSVDELKTMVGKQIRAGEWFLVTQENVNAFADLTGDHNFLHVDTERAKTSMYGGTIAHGLYTLSITRMLLSGPESVRINLPTRAGINYGYDRVRFPAPVPVGKRIRGRSKLLRVEEVQPNVIQIVQEITVDVEGEAKPAMVAEHVTRTYL
jgi:acyl dehydratase